MAKPSKKSQFYSTVNELITIAKNKNTVHLYTEENGASGKTIKLKGYNKPMINFGSCSYLGLEYDSRIIESGIQHLKNYGSQFSSSRTYVSIHPYQELENLVSTIFSQPILLSPNSTLGHMATIPAIIEENDAIIIDHQAHISMHHAIKLIDKKISLTLVRHNNLAELEQKINELKNTHNRIWYFMDGIYSMYGDVSPAKGITELLNKYSQFHLYVDDAHGMSWTGEFGKGYFLSQIDKFHPKMILSTSLAKSFGSSGGVFVFPNEEWCWKVRTWGGPLTYSGPQQPATIGCSIASAKIHLSNELLDLQSSLLKKIKLCNELLLHYQLPLISEEEVPIKFIGVGLPKVGYNLVHKLMNDGFYVNLGIYPAVPETCTGIRFTLTNHLSNTDIEALCESIHRNLPIALKEEDRTSSDIYKAFKQLKHKKNISLSPQLNNTSNLKLYSFDSIAQINADIWDEKFSNTGFNQNTLKILESSFQNNEKPEDNWNFKYYLIYEENEIVAMTFFTSVLIKNDMLLDEKVSKIVEMKRKKDPYYATSRCLMMGSPITEGEHLYLNKSNPNCKAALNLLVNTISDLFAKEQYDLIFLRDFPESDIDIRDYFINMGFIKTQMPESNELDISNWTTEEEFIQQLPQKKRTKLRKEFISIKKDFVVKCSNKIEKINHDDFYKLYLITASKSLKLNTFVLPYNFFDYINNDSNIDKIEIWEADHANNPNSKPIAIGYSIITKDCYIAWVLGISDSNSINGTYRTLLYNAVLRAKQLGCSKIKFGFTANEEKSKLGAKQIAKVAYTQVRDNYNFMELGLMEMESNMIE